MPKEIKTTNEIDGALKNNSPVAIGVSGGKDSAAVALATLAHLNKIGHAGPRLLIHADLGTIEWKDSYQTCERIATHTQTELVVVKRKKGDMIQRWEQRWEDNIARFENLETVKLILPWSTPNWRFCTSELKSAPIAQELIKRYPNETIINVTGIRAAESANRAKQPICKVNPRFERKKAKTRGLDWNPIHGWATEEVYKYLNEENFELHEAYRIYKSERVSCCFCIMSSQNDLEAAMRCKDNEMAWRDLMKLEQKSTFQFQSGKWLANLGPERLTPTEIADQKETELKAKKRIELERKVPANAELKNGIPKQKLTYQEATQVAEYRVGMGKLLGLDPAYTTAEAIMTKYNTDGEKKEQELELELRWSEKPPAIMAPR